MDLLYIIRNIVENSTQFVKCSNYYYENHICSKTNESKKVQLDYKLSCDTSDNIVKLGHCPDCKTCFYHKDFESKSL